MAAHGQNPAILAHTSCPASSKLNVYRLFFPLTFSFSSETAHEAWAVTHSVNTTKFTMGTRLLFGVPFIRGSAAEPVIQSVI